MIGLAILKNRSKGACLFVKDAGIYGDDSTTEGEAIGFWKDTPEKLQQHCTCGQDQDVIYDRIYIGYKYTFVEPDQLVVLCRALLLSIWPRMLSLPI